MIVHSHSSIIEDVPKNTFFEEKIVINFINCSDNLKTHLLLFNDNRVGYAIMKYEESVYSLEIFEIFDPYKGLGYGSWFINYLRNIYVFHLQPFNNTVNYYLKLGAVPILRYGKTLIVGFLKDIKPSDYFKKISDSNSPDNNDFQYNDEFIYNVADWIDWD